MDETTLNIAMIPLHIKWYEKKANLESFERILSRIRPDTDIVILPETFNTGFPSGESAEYVSSLAETHPGKTVERLRQLSSLYNVAISGSYIAECDGALFNRVFFITPSGKDYFSDKRHLFSMAGEDGIFTPGTSRMSVSYKGFKIAVVVCYDIRFPVWCRNVDNEYDMLIVVANWPDVRVDAWNKLLFARAIENQAYVCGVNCTGIDNRGFEYGGSSMAIDFKGKDITTETSFSSDAGDESDNDISVLYAVADKGKLDAFRSKFPAWKDADPFSLG